jgi:hypothetical protein
MIGLLLKPIERIKATPRLLLEGECFPGLLNILTNLEKPYDAVGIRIRTAASLRMS